MTHKRARGNGGRRLVPLLLLALWGFAASGCGDDGAEPAPPAMAHLVMLHSVSDLGEVEVLVDGAVAVTVAPGQRTEAIDVAPGTVTLGLRNPGASSALVEEDLELVAQTYFIAITGQSGTGSLGFWRVDKPAPAVEPGKSAIEVVSLYDGDYVFDVYVNETSVADGVISLRISDFVTVDAGTSDILVFNAGDDPSVALPIASATVSLPDGSTNMILIDNGATARSIGVDVIGIAP